MCPKCGGNRLVPGVETFGAGLILPRCKDCEPTEETAPPMESTTTEEPAATRDPAAIDPVTCEYPGCKNPIHPSHGRGCSHKHCVAIGMRRAGYGQSGARATVAKKPENQIFGRSTTKGLAVGIERPPINPVVAGRAIQRASETACQLGVELEMTISFGPDGSIRIRRFGGLG